MTMLSNFKKEIGKKKKNLRNEDRTGSSIKNSICLMSVTFLILLLTKHCAHRAASAGIEPHFLIGMKALERWLWETSRENKITQVTLKVFLKHKSNKQTGLTTKEFR